MQENFYKRFLENKGLGEIMEYEKLSKEQLIELIKQKSLFSEFKAEINDANSQKEVNDIFIRLNNKVATNDITVAEFAQLREQVNKKYEELKTQEQIKAEELARLSFIEKFKVENEPKEDEEVARR